MLPALLAREVALRSLPSPGSFLSRLASRPFALSNHRLFSTATGIHALELDLAQHRFLLATGGGGSVQIFDTAEGPDYAASRSPLLNVRHGSGDAMVRAAGWHTDDCGLFVTGSIDGTVWLWDTEKAQPAAKLNVKGAVSGVSFAGSAALVAVAFAPPHASHAPQLRLWDVRQGSIAAHTFILPARPTVLLAPPHAPFLLCGTALGHLLYLDPRHPLPVVAFSDSAAESGPAHAHDKAVCSITASPDARFIVSAAADHTVRLWSAPPLCKLQRVVYEGAVAPVAVTGGGYLIAGSGDTSLVQCDLLSGRLVTRLTGHLGAVHALAAHPFEGLVFSGGNDCTLLAWHSAAENRHYIPPALLLREDEQRT